jgi:hypothetical protein
MDLSPVDADTGVRNDPQLDLSPVDLDDFDLDIFNKDAFAHFAGQTQSTFSLRLVCHDGS